MNSHKKANKRYKHSTVELTATYIETLAVNLEQGHQYGLSVHFEKHGQFYQITRHGQDILECKDIIALINVTWAIVHFIDVGNQHLKAA